MRPPLRLGYALALLALLALFVEAALAGNAVRPSPATPR